MKIIDNPNFKRSRITFSILVVITGMAGIMFFLMFFDAEFDLMMVVFPLLLLGFALFSLVFVHGTVPYEIIMKNDILIIKSKFQKKAIIIKEVKGYDVDYQNNIRLIKLQSNNKNTIYPLAGISKTSQNEMVKYYNMKQYKFRFSEPWGVEEEIENDDSDKNKSIKITFSTLITISALFFTVLVMIMVIIFIKYQIDVFFLIITFPILLTGIIPIFYFAHKKGYLVRDEKGKGFG